MAESKRDRDRISHQVSLSIEARKLTDLIKDPRLTQDNPQFPLNDDQMMVFLTEKIGHLAGCVCGADNLAQQESALLKVTSFCKIWLENIEKRMRGK